MADNSLIIKKWIAAHNEFAQKTNIDFIKSPAATLEKVYPMNVDYVSRNRVFEKTLKQYLKDCGVEEFLGECGVYQYSVYTSGLFKGRDDICNITNIIYTNWNNMPADVIKESYLVASSDKKTALGVAVRVTDGTGGHKWIIVGRNDNESWIVPHADWEKMSKEAGLFEDTIEFICYTLVAFLASDKLPKNIGKLRVDKVIS